MLGGQIATYEGQQTLREILEWVLAHKRDVPAMDKINRATYPYTSHYSRKILEEAEGEDERLDPSP